MNNNSNKSRRVKSPGWAAFDLKKRQQDGEVAGKDPFPAIGDLPFTGLKRNHDNSGVFCSKSFSSVLLPSSSTAAGFPALKTHHDNNLTTPVTDFSAGYSDSNKVIEEKNSGNVLLGLKKLKELHEWADFSLIEDVMAGVDNDVEKASALLNGMVSNADFEKDEGAKFKSSFNTSLADDIADLSSTLEDALKDNDHKNDKNSIELREDVVASPAVDVTAAAANMKLILGHLKSVPIEPEWEEDDVYLNHRKNALRMMRVSNSVVNIARKLNATELEPMLASQHSRAATNAFLRRDHFSAQQYSLKAREEWSAAEELNAKAAKEILSIRNSDNNPWKLDLHGLHAAEAVQALQEHVQKIEIQAPKNLSTSPSRINTKNGIVHSSPFDAYGAADVENSDKQQAAIRQRPTSLQVITAVPVHVDMKMWHLNALKLATVPVFPYLTARFSMFLNEQAADWMKIGRKSVGNHSRGQAALPTAVRSFLNDNGYRFDETRPVSKALDLLYDMNWAASHTSYGIVLGPSKERKENLMYESSIKETGSGLAVRMVTTPETHHKDKFMEII
ncbi:unnamed protein product [Dovyalis caffra]|uniref:DUF1771 domain-containing protein n=1 Tax=Dovyalis caffra TaxID=77055 RepID=A0AAV1SEU4_9ROSI|nr:unnamed protein product [Dovyalis caffra]